MAQPTGDVGVAAEEPVRRRATAAYPTDWAAVEAKLSTLLEHHDLGEIEAFALAVSRPSSGGTRSAALSAEVRRQIALRLLRRLNLSLATGVASNGPVQSSQRLGHPAPLLPPGTRTQTGVDVLVPVAVEALAPAAIPHAARVQPKGIYCFYSREFIDELARLVAIVEQSRNRLPETARSPGSSTAPASTSSPPTITAGPRRSTTATSFGRARLRRCEHDNPRLSSAHGPRVPTTSRTRSVPHDERRPLRDDRFAPRERRRRLVQLSTCNTRSTWSSTRNSADWCSRTT